MKRYANWGKYFSIQFDIVVKKHPRGRWTNVFYFKAVEHGLQNDFVPALWIESGGYFHIGMHINNNQKNTKKVRFELGKTYHVTIRQSKRFTQFWYEIIIDNESKLKIENKNPKSWSKVWLYTSSTFNDPFTSEFGNVCNLQISNGKS